MLMGTQIWFTVHKTIEREMVRVFRCEFTYGIIHASACSVWRRKIMYKTGFTVVTISRCVTWEIGFCQRIRGVVVVGQMDEKTRGFICHTSGRGVSAWPECYREFGLSRRFKSEWLHNWLDEMLGNLYCAEI